MAQRMLWYRLLLGVFLTFVVPFLHAPVARLWFDHLFGAAGEVSPSARAAYVANGLDVGTLLAVATLSLMAVGAWLIISSWFTLGRRLVGAARG